MSYFQAVGKPKHAMLVALSRQVLVLIPAVLLLPLAFGLDGIWAAMPTADLVSTLLGSVLLWRELRQLRELRPGGRVGGGRRDTAVKGPATDCISGNAGATQSVMPLCGTRGPA